MIELALGATSGHSALMPDSSDLTRAARAVRGQYGDPTWAELIAAGRGAEFTELGWAVECSNVAEVRSLLISGADPNERFLGRTLPLHWALDAEGVAKSYGDDETGCSMSRLLVEHGASLVATDDEGRSALDVARRYLDTGAVHMLLQRLAAAGDPAPDTDA